ncbi:MAG: putative DNA binding domain-containing protein [Acidimicrobiia bacterium]|nr:putative DNA binding domain-containing protein [Acidimicrobiia bacterium]
MSTILVERALQLPPEEIADALLGLAESQWFERKGGRITAKKAAETAIAFANAEGGVLVVGASNGEVDGVAPKLLNDLQQMALDHTDPVVPARVDVVDADYGEQRHKVAVVRVAVGDHVVHATKADKVFLRVGDENRELTYAQRRELTFDRGQAAYERTPMEGELDTKLTESYAEAVGASDGWRLLRARGLVLDDDRTTVGCVLLFGVQPQSQLPHAHVRVVRHRGSTAETGIRQQLLADVRVEGPIPHQLVEARRVIKEQLPVRQALGTDGRFGPVGIVPEDAWMEGLVNAVVHRSYSISGDHIRVSVFDDRIEFESPGRFPGVVDLADPPALTRFARNPRIARVCADLRFGQELGEGIRRMFEEMRLAGLADPDFHQTAGSVRLTLRASPVDRALDDRLPARWRQAMQIIRDSGRSSTGEVEDALGVSRPVTIRLLRAMEEAGLLTWVGNSGKDPRAYWEPRVE